MKKITNTIVCNLFLLTTLMSFGQNDEQSGRNSVVKFAPSKMIRGEILFSYERKIAEQASIEISAGPAISNVSPINLDHIFGLGTNASESSLMGFTTSVGARYYPMEEEDALSGFYVSPVIGYTRLNYLFSAQNNGTGFPLADQRGNSRSTNFAFLFGTQLWISNTFSLDMYLGTGIKQITEDSYYIDYQVDPVTFQYTGAKWVAQPYTDVRWFLTGGIKVGIGFGKKY